MPENDNPPQPEDGSANDPRFLEALRKTTRTHAELFRRLAGFEAEDERDEKL